jgi:hypothetical protein
VVLGAVLLVMAPNLLFMLVSSFSQRRLAALEQAMFESNAGRAATYENQMFLQSSPDNKQFQAANCRHLSTRMDSQPHLYHYTPAHASRKAAFFYQPLEVDVTSMRQRVKGDAKIV